MLDSPREGAVHDAWLFMLCQCHVSKAPCVAMRWQRVQPCCCCSCGDSGGDSGNGGCCASWLARRAALGGRATEGRPAALAVVARPLSVEVRPLSSGREDPATALLLRLLADLLAADDLLLARDPPSTRLFCIGTGRGQGVGRDVCDWIDGGTGI